MKDRDLILDVLEQATTLLHADGGSIFLKHGNELRLASAIGAHSQMYAGTVYPPDSPSLTAAVFKSGQPLVVNDFPFSSPSYGRYDEVEHSRMYIKNLVAVPIELGDDTIGVLRCTNKTLDNAVSPFTTEDARILTIFARTAAAAIQARQDLIFATAAPYLFVLMPFKEEFKDSYQLGIRSVAVDLGIRCERVDEIEFNDAILAQIYKGIQSADLIVADVSGRNPNVFYEIGYAHAL